MEKTLDEIAQEIRGQEREIIHRELCLEEAAIHLAVETGFFYDLKHLKYFQRALLILTESPEQYRHLLPLCLRVSRELRCPVWSVAFWFWRHRNAVQRLKTPLAYKIAAAQGMSLNEMGQLDYLKICAVFLQTHRAIQHNQGKGWEGIFTDIFLHIDWQEIK